MAIKDDGEVDPTGWELALAKRWVKIAHRLMEDPEVAKMVSDLVARYRNTTIQFYPWTQDVKTSPVSPYTYPTNTWSDSATYNSTGGSDA